MGWKTLKYGENKKGKIDFKLSDDTIAYEWEVDSNDKFAGYKIIETGWYDVGNQKYLYKLEDGKSVVFENSAFGAQPTEYLERKDKYKYDFR